MKLVGFISLVCAALSVPVAAHERSVVEAVQASEDRAAIEHVLISYMFAVDQIDPDLFASLFTEDAEFFAPETPVRSGREEIRAIVGDAADMRDSRLAEGQAMPVMRHVLDNSLVTLLGPDAAAHRGYWATEMAGPDGKVSIVAMGWYEDELVKEDGSWLISKRHLYLSFPDRPLM